MNRLVSSDEKSQKRREGILFCRRTSTSRPPSTGSRNQTARRTSPERPAETYLPHIRSRNPENIGSTRTRETSGTPFWFTATWRGKPPAYYLVQTNPTRYPMSGRRTRFGWVISREASRSTIRPTAIKSDSYSCSPPAQLRTSPTTAKTPSLTSIRPRGATGKD